METELHETWLDKCSRESRKERTKAQGREEFGAICQKMHSPLLQVALHLKPN